MDWRSDCISLGHASCTSAVQMPTLALPLFHLQDVLKGAADEVLAVLKNQNLRDPDRQKQCVDLLGPTDNDTFAQLVALGKVRADNCLQHRARAEWLNLWLRHV